MISQPRRNVVTLAIVLAVVVVVGTVTAFLSRGSSDASATAARTSDSRVSPAPTGEGSLGAEAATAQPDSSLANPTPSRDAAAQPQPSSEAKGAPEDAVPIDPEIIQRAECGLRSSAISGLLGPSDVPTTPDDRLRDAVAVLQENLVDWGQALEARPELGPAIASAERILAAWQSAVIAFDTGDQAAADAAMGTAAAELENLKTTAGQDPCPG